MVGYYQPFIQNFASIGNQLTDLTKKDCIFQWINTEKEAFEILKKRLTENPILVYPDFSKEFYIACDASSTGLGAVLLQKANNNNNNSSN